MANVFTSLSNTIWYTDKCSISTGNTAVTYQVYATALGSQPAVGNIYSGPPELGSYEQKEIYVGVGNYITVTGTNYTAQEIGTQTSAQAGTGNFTEQFIPFAVLGSAQFSGSNYLSVAGGSGTAMGTGDFTWECWVRPTTSLGYQTFIDTRGIQTGYSGLETDGAYFGLNFDTLFPTYYQNGTLIVSSIAVTQDDWTHVALVRNSGTTTLYVGGASGGTYADSIDFTAPYVDIGGTFFATDLWLTGQISNLRMVKGTAVYTTPFTPPTAPLTAISGTQLLLTTPNDANFLVDSSTNNFTVTNNGAVTSSALTPF
jgi:hypothetical protein